MEFFEKKRFENNQTRTIEFDFVFFNKYVPVKIIKTPVYKKYFIFDKFVHKSYYKIFTVKNKLNIDKIFSEKEYISKDTKADIIIPVFNGYDYLEPLFESILKNTDIDYRLIVVDDCSPDKRVKQLLNGLKESFNSKIVLIENDENLGFVKSVNKALAISDENVIILNTDVILPKNWAGRLLSPMIKNKNVASVTPFSNSATIFSLPVMSVDNVFDNDLEKVNSYINKLNFQDYNLNFATGVGFCMAMNKDVIKKIGYFDEKYEKGYGEENDWCQRVVLKGYTNAIAPDLFVWHKHGGSFDNSEKQLLIKKHKNILLRRYRNFDKTVKQNITNEVYLSIRFFTELFYFKAISPNTICWFDHTRTGGTKIYTDKQIENLKKESLVVKIQNNGKAYSSVSFYTQKYKNEIILNDFEDVKTIIKNIVPDEIVVNNLSTYDNIPDVLGFVEEQKMNNKKMKVSYRVHDFQAICPAVNMFNSMNKYCWANSVADCRNCFPDLKNTLIYTDSIENYQTAWKNFLMDSADEVIVFSESTAGIFKKFFSEISDRIKIIPHQTSKLEKVNVAPHKKLNIGIIGTINVAKGAPLIAAIDKILPKYSHIKMKIIGNCFGYNFKHIKKTGTYQVEKLPQIIEKNKIDIILIPSLCPETFSYTTSEAMSMGVPTACFDIGAQAEKLKKYNKGIILSDIDAKMTLDELTAYWRSNKNV